MLLLLILILVLKTILVFVQDIFFDTVLLGDEHVLMNGELNFFLSGAHFWGMTFILFLFLSEL